MQTKMIIGSGFSEKDSFIAYVAYGSNMCEERFLKYLCGGNLEYSDEHGNKRVRHYKGCQTKDKPEAQYRCTIPYKRYFANASRIWNGGGVAYLDPRESRSGDATFCRVYIITVDQLFDVCTQEGDWYDAMVELGTLGNYRAFTITNSAKEEKRLDYINKPSQAYLDVIAKGEAETKALEAIKFDGRVRYLNEDGEEYGDIVKEYR